MSSPSSQFSQETSYTVVFGCYGTILGMADEVSGDESIQIIDMASPTRTEVVKGLASEPLVVKRVWPDGKVEQSRLVNPERSYQVPMFVFWDETVTPEQQELIHEAFNELFEQVGFDKTSLHFYGNWREQDYRDESGRLVSHKSIEWQLQSKYEESRGQINAEHVAREMYDDPYQVSTPHWEVVFTNKDLFTQETNFVIGVAQPDLGTVISLKRLEVIKDVGLRGETQKTEIFHEVGHVFGLPTSRRGRSNLEHSLGEHCQSKGCSMKQGLRVPEDWINFTIVRLKTGGHPYCNECTTDLKTKFHGDTV